MVTGSGRSSAALSARATMAMRYPPFALAAMSQPGAMAPDQTARFPAASASSAGKSSSATSVAVRNINDGLSRCSVTGSTPRDTESCRTSTEMRAYIPGCCPCEQLHGGDTPASLCPPDRVNTLSSAWLAGWLAGGRGGADDDRLFSNRDGQCQPGTVAPGRMPKCRTRVRLAQRRRPSSLDCHRPGWLPDGAHLVVEHLELNRVAPGRRSCRAAVASRVAGRRLRSAR